MLPDHTLPLAPAIVPLHRKNLSLQRKFKSNISSALTRLQVQISKARKRPLAQDYLPLAPSIVLRHQIGVLPHLNTKELLPVPNTVLHRKCSPSALLELYNPTDLQCIDPPILPPVPNFRPLVPVETETGISFTLYNKRFTKIKKIRIRRLGFGAISHTKICFQHCTWFELAFGGCIFTENGMELEKRLRRTMQLSWGGLRCCGCAFIETQQIDLRGLKGSDAKRRLDLRHDALQGMTDDDKPWVNWMRHAS